MPAAPAISRAFDPRIQILECHRCGAPLTSLPEDGHITCAYCDAVHQFEAPETRGEAEASAPGTDRAAWVRAQLTEPGRVSPFDPDANYLPELAEFEGKRWSPRQFRETPLPAFRAAWDKAVVAARSGARDDDVQFRLYWLADKLAHIYEFLAAAARLEKHEAERQNELLRWRAVLETGATLLDGTDYAYVLRCELARAAAKTGDQVAAREWLATLDPEPTSVDLDTEWRLARSTIAAAEGDGKTILALLGEDLATIPLSGERNRRTGAVLRVHAMEVLGRSADATRAYHEAGASIGFAKLWSELAILGYAPKFYAKRRKLGRWIRYAIAAVLVAGALFAVTRLLS